VSWRRVLRLTAFSTYAGLLIAASLPELESAPIIDDVRRFAAGALARANIFAGQAVFTVATPGTVVTKDVCLLVAGLTDNRATPLYDSIPECVQPSVRWFADPFRTVHQLLVANAAVPSNRALFGDYYCHSVGADADAVIAVGWLETIDPDTRAAGRRMSALFQWDCTANREVPPTVDAQSVLQAVRAR